MPPQSRVCGVAVKRPAYASIPGAAEGPPVQLEPGGWAESTLAALADAPGWWVADPAERAAALLAAMANALDTLPEDLVEADCVQEGAEQLGSAIEVALWIGRKGRKR
jgi:hypothetical protein